MLPKEFFKGWYFKCCGPQGSVALIPAVHRDGRGETASLQILTEGAAYSHEAAVPPDGGRTLPVEMGDCFFSRKGIRLQIQEEGLCAWGMLHFRELTPLWYPIMGPFRFVPFLPCCHQVYSMHHRVDGEITVNGQRFSFRNGQGYMEGDSGRSFPRRYIWTQSFLKNGSLMLAVADVPMPGGSLTGVIGVIRLNGKEHRLATYLGATAVRTDYPTVMVRQGGYWLCATLLEERTQPLLAPVDGQMNRTICESAACRAHYIFSHGGKVLWEETSNQASFEFEYPGRQSSAPKI